MKKADNPSAVFTILTAEDDPDDRFLIEEAFKKSAISVELVFVEDGEQLLSYLLPGIPESTATASRPRPSCILLDLNLPRKDGREALREIRQHPELKTLAVVVLTTSDSEEDKKICSELGVASYLTKPESFTELIDLIAETDAFREKAGVR